MHRPPIYRLPTISLSISPNGPLPILILLIPAVCTSVWLVESIYLGLILSHLHFTTGHVPPLYSRAQSRALGQTPYYPLLSRVQRVQVAAILFLIYVATLRFSGLNTSSPSIPCTPHAAILCHSRTVSPSPPTLISLSASQAVLFSVPLFSSPSLTHCRIHYSVASCYYSVTTFLSSLCFSEACVIQPDTGSAVSSRNTAGPVDRVPVFC